MKFFDVLIIETTLGNVFCDLYIEKATVIEMIRSALDTSDVQELLAAKASGQWNQQPADDWTQPVSDANGLSTKVDRLTI